jgi:multiple sugar transport system substrate-binding protein
MTSHMRIARRRLLAGAAGLALAPAAARAQAPQPFNILAHRVHQTVATDASRPGGDVTADWQARTNRRIVWTTLDVGPIHERLQRELSLAETSFDLGYVVNTAIAPRLLRLLEPLGPYQSREPIEDWGDVSPGLVRAVSMDGVPHAIPVRHATVGLFYNEELLAERGLSGPPQSLEDLIEHAQRLTYTRADGTQVTGFAIQGNSHFNMLTVAFGFDAPLIDPDMRLLPNEPGMLRTLETFRLLFERGAMPRNFPAMGQEDVFSLIQNGRVAMAYAIFGRYNDFNDPQRSRTAGKIKVVPAVASREIRTRVPLVATSDFWSLAIPRNSTKKDLAWSLIRVLSSREGTLRQALNGNGPIRASAYADPRLAASVPYAAIEARALPYARPPIPSFDRAQEAADIMMQTVQATVIGRMTPAEGVADLKRRVAPLLRG